MTTEIEWGDVPLTGPQMKALRDAGMPDDVRVHGRFDHAPAEQWDFYNRQPYYRLPAQDPSYLCHVHNGAYDTSFKPWYGGDEAPGDWDGKNALSIDSNSAIPRLVAGTVDVAWSASAHSHGITRIIGYHALPKQEEVGEGSDAPWASGWTTKALFARAQVLADEFGVIGGKNLTPLARYIAQHEQPPVDPDLIEAKAIVRKHYPEMPESYSGRRLYIAQEALRRGRELAETGK